MSYKSSVEIKVGIDFLDNPIRVGRLAIRERKVYFEYDEFFLDRGLNISPLRLPIREGLYTFENELFDGLPGVFNDSLPDGWGRLLLDRFVRSNGILPEELSPLDRLAYVGMSGMGALTYKPDRVFNNVEENMDLDVLYKNTQKVINDRSVDILEHLCILNGSSAGARPKVLVGVDNTYQNIVYGEHNCSNMYDQWIVKFSNTGDGIDSGAIEYVYSLMVKDAGLDMMPTYLFPSQKCIGYFATKRFDRIGNERVHVHSVSGLLHADFRVPSLDYEDLMVLTGKITKDIRSMEKMFRISVFNVLSYNRDDHAKNFSFLMDSKGMWELAPIYDVTFSAGVNGEQSMLVMGEGKNPSINNLKELGVESGIETKVVNDIIDQTKQALSKWKSLANQYGVTKDNILLIHNKMLSIK